MKFLKLAGYEPRKLWSFGYVRFLFVLLLAVNMLSAFIYCDESLYIESNSEYSYTREDVFYVHSLYENDPEWFEDAYKVIVNKWEEWEGDVQPESFYSKCDWYTFEHVYKDVHAYENYVSDIEKTLKMGVRFREMLGFMPQYPGLYPNFPVARTENAVAFSASNLFTSLSLNQKSRPKGRLF